MWMEGRRRGGAKDLSKHLLKTDENESVEVLELSGFSFDAPTSKNLEKALKQMEAIGFGKGDKRNIYHGIIAPAYGCTLNPAEKKIAVEYYLEHMGFKGFQYALVEHWKHGKQHFHIAVNIIDPVTGKTHELKYTKNKEWRISRGLEEIFGHPTPSPHGKSIRVWEMQRASRSGIDPRKMRKQVTAIYKTSHTAQEFAAALDKAGYTLTRGTNDRLVLVDKVGDPHGLMRRIEGKKTLADLRRKFPGIDRLPFEPYEKLVKERKAVEPAQERKVIDPKQVQKDVQKAYANSKTGVEFFANLNRKEYSLGRGLKGFAVIDLNGNRHDIDQLLGKEAAKGLNKKFPDLASIRPRPVSEIIRRMKVKKPRGKKSKGRSRTSFARGRGFIPVAKQFSSFSPALTRPVIVPPLHKSTEAANRVSPPKPIRHRRSAEDKKFIPRPEIPDVEINAGRADIAYQEEFDKWQGLIDAAAHDLSLTKDQRIANVTALRLRQQAAAQAVRKRVLDEEKSIAKAARRAKKALLGVPPRKPQA